MTVTSDEFELPAPDHARADLAGTLGLSGSAVDRATRASRASGQPLAVALSLLGLATEEAIADACSQLYDAPRWPDTRPIEPLELPGLNARFLQDRYAIAMADDTGEWCLGLVDPGDAATREALWFALGREIRIRTITLSGWRQTQTSVDAIDLPQTAAPIAATWLDDAERLRDNARDAPVVRISEQILERAFLLNASDVHIEQKIDHTRVRLRIDGQLQDQDRLPSEIGPALIARIKVLSDLDVAERRAPQDGRTTINVRGVPVDVRISTTPTVFGESLVVRLLTRRDVEYSLERLGLRDAVTAGLDQLLKRTHGLLLVTGPTGSGKTTTLYAGLRRLASSRQKILTVEDPVEYVFEDILQSQVNEAAGFTFSTALRSFLRHDPDVILVGEIRDTETARLAVQASLTGHLVLATVHTNDAATTPSRLIDMGVERYLLGDALIGVMAQRLAAQLCAHCHTLEPLDVPERAALADAGLPSFPRVGRAQGCPACGGTGRRGRRAITELMVCTPEVSELIGVGAPASALRETLPRQTGYASLRQDALSQSAQGLVDWGDAWRLADR
ncbi:GspE/PulE family protein [Brevundimonas sp. M20]|uniref:GspE/PulE family protein n=1 Tax=Brevundimonas sp. M20 TaxID=2591463 RepID=UPI0011476D76|nr:GspE/PulE family protein [Brevundimonas sp. M20]QDH72316.1 type II/IV secretion system protein [Brevundimonas sp. M20]